MFVLNKKISYLESYKIQQKKETLFNRISYLLFFFDRQTILFFAIVIKWGINHDINEDVCCMLLLNYRTGKLSFPIIYLFLFEVI